MLLALIAAATLGASPVSPILAAMPLRADGSDLTKETDEPAPIGIAGTAMLNLTIGSDGRLDRCDVLTSSGSTKLDSSACVDLRRHRFVSGRDRAGTPLPALTLYSYTIFRAGDRGSYRALGFAPAASKRPNYTIQVNRLPAEAASLPILIDVITAQSGEVADCIVARSSDDPVLDRLACTTIATARLPPALGGDGQPIRALRRLSIGFAATSGSLAGP